MPSSPACVPISAFSTPTTSIRLLKQLIQAEGLDDKRWPARQFAHDDRRLEEQGPTAPADIPEGDARAFANGKGRELYAAYQNRLQDPERLRFRRPAVHPIRIFRANPDVLKEYHAKFRYILVDEYQDTNTAQYMWLRLLAQRPQAERGEPSPSTSAASATTTSRSMAGAGPKSTTSCASRRIFPAPGHPA